MENRMRRLGLAIALIALGAASAFAVLSLNNITCWIINATKPSVEKHVRADTAAYPNNMYVIPTC
jgi:hypothetical protein